MTSGIILYSSTYGSTKGYADQIGKELGYMSYNVAQDILPALDHYDVIIVGGAVYMGKIRAAAWLNTNWTACQHARVYFFSVGETPSTASEQIHMLWNTNLQPEVLKKTACVHLQGYINYPAMSLFHKLVVRCVMYLQGKKLDTNNPTQQPGSNVSNNDICEFVAYIKQNNSIK